MKKTKRLLAITGLAAALSAGTALAQNNGNNNNNGGGRSGGRNDWRNMSPEERQQERMNRTREELEVKDDAEWKIIQPLVQKVEDARRQVMADRMAGMMSRFRGGGGDNGGGDNGGDRRRSRGGGGLFGDANPSPESETLKKAVDGKASNSDMKAAIAKFLEARKANEAALQKAQDDLRKVLSVRQEGIATLNGLL
jgi:hypothetical protein